MSNQEENPIAFEEAIQAAAAAGCSASARWNYGESLNKEAMSLRDRAFYRRIAVRLISGWEDGGDYCPVKDMHRAKSDYYKTGEREMSDADWDECEYIWNSMRAAFYERFRNIHVVPVDGAEYVAIPNQVKVNFSANLEDRANGARIAWHATMGTIISIFVATTERKHIDRWLRGQENRDLLSGGRVAAFSGFTRTASRKLDQLDAATDLRNLSRPGNRLKALKGRRKG